jgi:hypothetical protein
MPEKRPKKEITMAQLKAFFKGRLSIEYDWMGLSSCFSFRCWWKIDIDIRVPVEI